MHSLFFIKVCRKARSVPMLILLFCSSCIEYSPNQIILEDDQKDLTGKNLKKILSQSPDDAIKIVLIGDTQRFYDEAADFVHSVNQLKDIDFVVHTGDISDFGLEHEFKWVQEIMEGLKYPYLTVVGNHDLLANGRKVYSRMYGPLDYTFEYGGYHFVMINTNGREFMFNGNVPNLSWLEQQLNSVNDRPTIVVSHIPPFDDDFDSKLENGYASLLAENDGFTLSLHGHRHNYMDTTWYNDGIRYIVTTTIGKRGYYVLNITPESVEVQEVNY